MIGLKDREKKKSLKYFIILFHSKWPLLLLLLYKNVWLQLNEWILIFLLLLLFLGILILQTKGKFEEEEQN